MGREGSHPLGTSRVCYYFNTIRR